MDNITLAQHMATITLGQIKRNQKFCFHRDGKIYTFMSYTLRDVFYDVNAWHDSHYDYDEYGCKVLIYVKERATPLTIRFDDSTQFGKDSKTKAEAYVEKKVLNLCIGYKDAGVNTRYLNNNFEHYIVVWFDKEHNCLQYQMFDEWDDLSALCNKLDAAHIPHKWYD